MRRKTFQIPQPFERSKKDRRHRTCVQSNQEIMNLRQHLTHTHLFVSSQFVIKKIINELITDDFSKQLTKIQMKKIVDETMNQCTNLYRNENWQIDPNGPSREIVKQTLSRLDDQPQIRKYGTINAYTRPKIYRQRKISTQSSVSMSRFKQNQKNFQPKQSPLKPIINRTDSQKSFRSINSSRSNNLSEMSKLVPLRIQTQNTPQISSKRNLQDFLREKKLNAEINLGYKVKFMSDFKENLKTIKQFPNSHMFLKTFKNITNETHNQIKLPYISSRQQCGTDYDGQAIPLQRHSKLKKTAQILKTICKISSQNQQNNKLSKPHRPIKHQFIKAKTFSTNHQSINSQVFTSRCHQQNQVQALIQQNLLTNRVKFKHVVQNLKTVVNFEDDKHDSIKQKQVNSMNTTNQKLIKVKNSSFQK